ncbi:hypothetical protein PWP93_05280 [Paraburkholderia sp. A1RI-2L]|uniref:hypothetical protein n=1 Tax=Paraburkholderia sp. A1RI-2L TaxID=3028367 RepID=UPI003B76470E
MQKKHHARKRLQCNAGIARLICIAWNTALLANNAAQQNMANRDLKPMFEMFSRKPRI